MGLFNHVSKNKSTSNISSGTARFDLIFSVYVRNDDLHNYLKNQNQLIWVEIE